MVTRRWIITILVIPSHFIMSSTFVVLSEMSQKLSDWLPWNMVQTSMLPSENVKTLVILDFSCTITRSKCHIINAKLVSHCKKLSDNHSHVTTRQFYKQVICDLSCQPTACEKIPDISLNLIMPYYDTVYIWYGWV